MDFGASSKNATQVGFLVVNQLLQTTTKSVFCANVLLDQVESRCLCYGVELVCTCVRLHVCVCMSVCVCVCVCGVCVICVCVVCGVRVMSVWCVWDPA